MASVCICTPAGRFADRVQELHIKVLHILIELVERHFHPENYAVAPEGAAARVIRPVDSREPFARWLCRQTPGTRGAPACWNTGFPAIGTTSAVSPLVWLPDYRASQSRGRNSSAHVSDASDV